MVDALAERRQRRADYRATRGTIRVRIGLGPTARVRNLDPLHDAVGADAGRHARQGCDAHRGETAFFEDTSNRCAAARTGTSSGCQDRSLDLAVDERVRDLATDPNAWTQPERFAAPDRSADLTSRTQQKLAALPEGFRAVVRLVDIEERSYREAADTLGVPVGTVMSRLHRGRKLLAQELLLEAA